MVYVIIMACVLLLESAAMGYMYKEYCSAHTNSTTRKIKQPWQVALDIDDTLPTVRAAGRMEVIG